MKKQAIEYWKPVSSVTDQKEIFVKCKFRKEKCTKIKVLSGSKTALILEEVE